MTREFIAHMPVDKILKVIVHPQHGPAQDDWPDSPSVPFTNGFLDEGTVREFLADLDIVYAAETVYDWRLIHWAREMGVKVVVHGMPEFYKHGRAGGPSEKDHPTEWWWPTMWRMGLLPSGPWMPVPMPDHVERVASDVERLGVLHVVGKRAWKDRNGTDIFIQAIRNTSEPMDVTICGIDGELPIVQPQGNIRWLMNPNPRTDRWSMYANQDVLVLPRRYGGLCLPASEAEACGVAVMMPNTQPNDEHAQILTRVQFHRTEMFPSGPMQVIEADPYDIARSLDDLAKSRAELRAFQHQAYTQVSRWSTWAPRYIIRLENLCQLP